MSETVHYVGKLQLIQKKENETLEDVCKRILNEHNYLELESYCDTWEEMLYEDLYNKYVVVKNDVFKVVTKEDKDLEYDIFNLSKNSDGTYDYEVMYYNGGCGFSEAIEEAFERLDNKTKE